jgi:hypothetical protein
MLPPVGHRGFCGLIGTSGGEVNAGATTSDGGQKAPGSVAAAPREGCAQARGDADYPALIPSAAVEASTAGAAMSIVGLSEAVDCRETLLIRCAVMIR